MKERGKRSIDYNRNYFSRAKSSNTLNKNRKMTGRISSKRIKTEIYRDRDFDQGGSLELEHIVARFRNFIGIGGTVQRLSEESGVERDTIIMEGSSQFQDQSAPNWNGKTEEHAAHLIQARIHPNASVHLNEIQVSELKNRLGQTEILPIDINQRTATIIDKVQENILKEKILGKINFSKTFDDEGNVTAMSEILHIFKTQLSAELHRRGGPYDNESFDESVANNCWDIQRDLLDQALLLYENPDFLRQSFQRGMEDYYHSLKYELDKSGKFNVEITLNEITTSQETMG